MFELGNYVSNFQKEVNVVCIKFGSTSNVSPYSQVAAHILPVGDPAMLITVNVF